MRTPVFIIGSPRSGTSALVDVALAAGYRGFREGMFLNLLVPLSELVDRHFRTYASATDRETLVSVIDQAAFKSALHMLLKTTVERYSPAPPWFDKTGNPEMIEAVPILRALWPEAAFVFAKRRAIENVHSRLRKFPEHGFEYHCRDWARNMNRWRMVRDSVPPTHRREVDQREMILNPERVAEQLQHLFQVPAVRREAMIEVMRKNRPQQTRSGSAEAVHDIDSIGWTPQQIETFIRLCGTEMGAYGYSLNDSYWTSSA